MENILTGKVVQFLFQYINYPHTGIHKYSLYKPNELYLSQVIRPKIPLN